MKRIIWTALFFLLVISNLSANNENGQDDMLSMLSEEDIEIIKNLDLLENLETLERIQDEDFELLENLEIIESMTENEEESQKLGDKNEYAHKN